MSSSVSPHNNAALSRASLGSVRPKTFPITPMGCQQSRAIAWHMAMAGLTYEGLAAIAGVSKGQAYRWCDPHNRQLPNARHIKALSRAMPGLVASLFAAPAPAEKWLPGDPMLAAAQVVESAAGLVKAIQKGPRDAVRACGAVVRDAQRCAAMNRKVM